MQHQRRVQHKIHYTSFEKVSKKYFMQAIYNSNYTQKIFKIITMKNHRINTKCKYTMQFTTCTTSMNLFELCCKEKANYFV